MTGASFGSLCLTNYLPLFVSQVSGVITCYSMERDRRANFLLTQEAHLQRQNACIVCENHPEAKNLSQDETTIAKREEGIVSKCWPFGHRKQDDTNHF